MRDEGIWHAGTGYSVVIRVQDLNDPGWLDAAPLVTTVSVDGWMAVVPDFYFGPENGFTPAQWTTLREPIGAPLLAVDGWLPAELALAHFDSVLEHHRRLLAIARRHGRPLRVGSPELWLRPRIVGDGRIAPAFAWTDTYQATNGLLLALCADREGELVSDVDQGWELLARREGDVIRLGERNWEVDDDPGRAFAVDRTQFVTAATAACARIDDLLARLTDELGEDPWGLRTRS